MVFFISFSHDDFQRYHNDSYNTGLTKETMRALLQNLPRFMVEEKLIFIDVHTCAYVLNENHREC